MQLPKELQKFSHPYLVVLADHVHAQFWLAHGETLELLTQHTHEPELKSDNETSFVNVDTHGTSGPEQNEDRERLRKFTKELDKKIQALIPVHSIQHLFLAMDAELLGPVKEHLLNDTKKLLKKTVPKNLMKEPPTDAIRHILITNES